MKTKEWFDIHQADSYLSNSIIRLGNEPIFVSRVRNDDGREINSPTIYYWELGHIGSNRNLKQISLKHKDLDFNPVPLGMLATSPDMNKSFFISRIPRRAWKIGLSNGNIEINNVSSDSKKTFRIEKTSVLYSIGLKNTIKNEYLDFDGATKLSKDSGVPIAFSRRFSIWGNELYYKTIGQPVGELDKKTPVLYDNFIWVKESLNEDLNGKDNSRGI